MSIFEIVKETVSIRQAAECYGLKSNRNNMACCPFHNDRASELETERGLFFLLRLRSQGRCN